MARGTGTSSFIVYPSQGSPKSFGYLKSARVWAQTKANESGVSSVIYAQGGKGGPWHVKPTKATNPRTTVTERAVKRFSSSGWQGKEKMHDLAKKLERSGFLVNWDLNGNRVFIVGTEGDLARAKKIAATVNNPRTSLKPNRLTPVAFTVKGKRHTGKAKLVGGKVKVYVTANVARKINPKYDPIVTERSVKSFSSASWDSKKNMYALVKKLERSGFRVNWDLHGFKVFIVGNEQDQTRARRIAAQ